MHFVWSEPGVSVSTLVLLFPSRTPTPPGDYRCHLTPPRLPSPRLSTWLSLDAARTNSEGWHCNPAGQTLIQKVALAGLRTR